LIRGELWLSVLAVTAATWALKASGPLALGDRQLPRTAIKITTLMAPVLLAGLIVVDLGGAGWKDLDWAQVLGVSAAGLARTLKAPMLLAVVCGIAATALLRLLLA
jgi:branched-subunit amino acid transport protein